MYTSENIYDFPSPVVHPICSPSLEWLFNKQQVDDIVHFFHKCSNIRVVWNVILNWLERLSGINLKNIFIFNNIWFAIQRLNKYILYGKGFLNARRPPKTLTSLDTQISLSKQKTKYMSSTIASSISNSISTSKSYLTKTTLM